MNRVLNGMICVNGEVEHAIDECEKQDAEFENTPPTRKPASHYKIHAVLTLVAGDNHEQQDITKDKFPSLTEALKVCFNDKAQLIRRVLDIDEQTTTDLNNRLAEDQDYIGRRGPDPDSATLGIFAYEYEGDTLVNSAGVYVFENETKEAGL